MVMRKHVGAGIASALLAVSMAGGAVADVNFGKEKEKINLMVGYQPYYAGSWSGVVNNSKQFWKKYLPEGSTASFQVGLQGAVIVNAMTGEKLHLGYVGDMPGIAATFRVEPARGGTDIRIVASIGTSRQQCNVFMVRNDAPEFKDGKEAIKWMDQKTVSLPQGSCTDRFAQLAFKELNVKPGRYLNQNIEVITSNFKVGKLDAAVIWEPTASKIVSEGLARRAASGEDIAADDGGFLIVLNDLLKQRPDVVKGWLESEVDSQLYISDLNNTEEVLKMVESQTEKIDRDSIFMALYGAYPASQGGGDTKIEYDFIINERVQKLLDDATAFLNSMPSKPASTPKIREGGVDDKLAREVLAARGLSSPIATIKAQAKPAAAK